MQTSNAPRWWTEEHSSAWERSKEALRRDWEQTKADLGAGGHELNQSVGDTLEQAAGRQPLPHGNSPNPEATHDLAWAEAEPAVRYGHGARSHHQRSDWDDELEATLPDDWATTWTDTPWARVRNAVRRGWESAKTKAPAARS